MAGGDDGDASQPPSSPVIPIDDPTVVPSTSVFDLHWLCTSGAAEVHIHDAIILSSRSGHGGGSGGANGGSSAGGGTVGGCAEAPSTAAAMPAPAKHRQEQQRRQSLHRRRFVGTELRSRPYLCQ